VRHAALLAYFWSGRAVALGPRLQELRGLQRSAYRGEAKSVIGVAALSFERNELAHPSIWTDARWLLEAPDCRMIAQLGRLNALPFISANRNIGARPQVARSWLPPPRMDV